MANLPSSSSSMNANTIPREGKNVQREMQLAMRLVNDITNPHLRENALSELAEKREQFKDLAIVLWHAFGIMTIFMQEIMAVYPAITTPTLTSSQSRRICNVVALLQCVASHDGTRNLFIKAEIAAFLYPFLNTKSNLKPFEYLRITSLGVISAMVKVDDSKVIDFFIKTEIMPICLEIMKTGTELSKTLATFIVYKILQNNAGLNFVCETSGRFFDLAGHLENMVTVEQPSPRLLKHVVLCYLRLSEHKEYCKVLMGCLPNVFRDSTRFASSFRVDPEIRGLLRQLLKNVLG